MRTWKFFATTAICVAVSTAAHADWPERPVSLVVPWGAGGLADSVARAFTGAIERQNLLGQPVAVINSDAHFSIGMRRVVDATPDGGEFLLANIAIMAGEASGVMEFGYRDLVPVAETGESCFIPTVRADSGIEDIAGLLEATKADEPVVVGVNIGANNHVAAAMLEKTDPDASFRYTQTGGDTASFTALKGEQIDLAFLSAAAISKFLADGSGGLDTSQFRPLGYMGEQRHNALPDLPTVKEQEVDASFCIPLWWFAPEGTDDAVVARLATVLEEAANSESVQSFYADRMMTASFYSGDELSARLDRLWERTRPLAEQVARSK